MASLPSIPQALGPYLVEEVIGQGGMGVVLRGRHRELGTVRALKVLTQRGDGRDARRLARFEREVQALAKVRHPALIAVHECGQDGPWYWFAMDLVVGEPLSRYIAQTPLSPSAAAALAAQIARAVEALHRAGLVHRDLKTDNVMIKSDGDPVVLDLGLVRGEDDDRLTKTGALVGTLTYMAPEQIGGQSTPRTDVYALGLIAFELFTKTVWFDSASIGSGPALLSVIAQQDRPLPSSVDPDLPRSVDALIGKATHRDPEQRFADAGELAAALEALELGGWTRRGVQRGALAAGVLLAGGALVAALTQGAPSPPSQSIQPSPVVDAAPDPNREGEAAFAALRKQRGAELLDAAAAWLEAHPEHPRRAEVLDLRREAARKPRRVWEEEGRTQGVYGQTAILVAGHKRQEAVCRGPDGPVLARYVNVGRSRSAAARSANHQHLALLFSDHLLLLDDRGKQRAKAPIGFPTKIVAISEDGALACVGGSQGLAILRTADGELLHELTPRPQSPRALAFSHDGSRLVVAAGNERDPNADNGLTLWDVASGEQLDAWDSQSGEVQSVVLDPTGNRIATGDEQGHVRIFDLATLEPLYALTAPTGSDAESNPFVKRLRSREPRAHRWAVRAVAYTPDGKGLISMASSDVEESIARWDLERRELLWRKTFEGIPRTVDVSADGRRLLVSLDERLEEWELLPPP